MTYTIIKRLLVILAIFPSALSMAVSTSNSVPAGEATGFSMDTLAFDAENFEIPMVLTASRLRQSQLDAPASVTVIQSDTIAALGFKDIEDIFRLVPGMLVGYHSGFGNKTPSVSYHGTQASEHRRLQVLIDGHSVFKPGLARVEWNDIPLAIEDIARIEIIRGPNSATYGANSYLGTINILTKHPQGEKGVNIKVRSGSQSVNDQYINFSGAIGTTSFRWTLAHKKDNGFDTFSDGITENRDSLDSRFTMLRTFTQLNTQTSMEWQAGFKTGTNLQRRLHEGDGLIYNTEEDIDAQDTFIWNKLNYEFSASQFSHLQIYSHEYIRTQEWNGCFSESLCGDLNKNLDEQKSEIEYEHTSIWNPQVRTVAGIRFRLDKFDSETYNGGSSENVNASAFSSVEYKFGDRYTANIGAMYEDDEINGRFFSPRVALNVSLTSLQTLRFIYSEAIRAPDLFEQNGQLIFLMRNTDSNGTIVPLPFGTAETDTLGSEKIYSKEISYFAIIPSVAIQVDIKLFREELSSLISESLSHANPLTNDNKMVMQGIEGQVTLNMDVSHKVMATFAYIDSDYDFPGNNENIKFETRLSADRSGSLSWIYTISPATQFSSALYHVENWNSEGEGNNGFTFSRLDLHVNHSVFLDAKYHVNLSATVEHRIDDDPMLFVRNKYNDKTHFYISAELAF
jgi:iron complex outermembrane receptor protein